MSVHTKPEDKIIEKSKPNNSLLFYIITNPKRRRYTWTENKNLHYLKIITPLNAQQPYPNHGTHDVFVEEYLRTGWTLSAASAF